MILITIFFLFLYSPLVGQISPEAKETLQAPSKVEIRPTARDYEIQDRLEAILETTEWFKNTHVEVREGVVFLNGIAKKEEFKKWAGDLARNTQDVSAVVNRLEVEQPSVWDFHPTWIALKEQWRDLVQILPTIAFGIIILVLTWLLAKVIISFTKKILKKRIPSPLLQEVIARTIGFCVFLFGFYIIFRMLGLTTIAFTIIGGTGILGVILGIAFRDITENLLASIFLSIHHPFKSGDLVQIEGLQGFVQKLTMRSTVLLGLDGNHIQIPNATVYKTNILNYSVNPNRQDNFLITVAYDEPITEVQDIIMKVLSDHPAILDDPEPLVLVESLEKATIFIRIYFWFNGLEHSWLKVKSSVMRFVKRALQEKEIKMAAEGRELTFPERVPIQIFEKDQAIAEEKPPVEPAPIATSSENKLTNEYQNLQEQAKLSREPETEEENLLSD